jgi:hypothetical protein
MEGSPGTGRDETGRRRGSVWSRADPWALAELFALTGMVIAQPVLDVTGRSPDMFLFRRADRLDILALVVGVTVLPALTIWALELLVGLVSGTVRRLLHLAPVTGLLAVLAFEVVKATTGLRGPGLAAVAAAGGLGGGVLYAGLSWPRLWLRFLTPAPLVFALLFLLASPTSALVLPARAPSAPPVAAAPGDRPPVVMILFDEFPLGSLLDAEGRIDGRVYPNFAALAADSTWYRNATGVAGFTPWALPAMLTGNYPAEVRAPSYTEYPDNLFTLLGRSYEVQAYETISQLCPPRQCASSVGDPHQSGLRGVVGDSARVLKQLLQPYDAAFDPSLFADQRQPRAASAPDSKEAAAARFGFKLAGRRNQPGRFNDFLAGLEAGDRPTLHFLHLLLPHQPWRYLPSGNEYNFETLGGAYRSDRLPAPLVDLAHQRHLLQVAYTDRLVGQVMAKLKAEGLWDRSLVVMGADHGVGWTPGEPSRTLGPHNAPELMWVPQFIKAPGQDDGVVDDRNWEQVDLLPTVADLAGIPVPWTTDGRSQTGPPTRTRTDKWWFDVPGRRQVRDGPANWKLVLAGETDTLVRGAQGPRGLYRFGAAADLVGRDPASVGPIGGAPATAVLDDRRSLETVDPGSGKVPALVSGRLGSPPPPGATVLVAVNGRIGGGSRLFPGRPGEPAVRFAAITPDYLWRPGLGRAQLRLYLADTGGGRPRLRPVSVSA